ncbi:flagellar basal body rod C-terminal domain-containing protein [Plastorhodobacter daqingensis]|uniref:Flagellar hook-associated protein 1 n=1 Tax=Plastorhodobacter daqingensis TaxID=1387281 RepID=A0ABW2UI50_9RHOB
MSSLLDIARSGILAYRSALAVTGQNIANLNTEGYHRREASLIEVAGARTSPTTLATSGQGVLLEDVRRAYDSFLAQRLLDARGAQSSAGAFVDQARALEDALLPGERSLGAALEGFFDAIARISAAPADLATRAVAIEEGRLLAGTVSDMAMRLVQLQQAIEGQAEQLAGEANGLLRALADTQGRLMVAGGGGAGTAALLDERDLLLGRIGEILGISVTHGAHNAMTVTLGAAGNGPVILADRTAASLSFLNLEGQMRLQVRQDGRVQTISQLGGGALHGLMAANSALSEARGQLDRLAQQVARDMNAAHRQGLDLDRQPGGPLFSLNGWKAEMAPGNLGRFALDVALPAGELPPGQVRSVQLVWHAAAGQWQAHDDSGRLLATGREEITLGGVRIRPTGAAADGDTIRVELTEGRAADMRFLLTRPEDFAAAALRLVQADPANTGRATLVADPAQQAYGGPGLMALAQLAGIEPSAISALHLRQDGVVGVLPAGTMRADLFSLARQPSLGLSLTAQEMILAERLRLDLGAEGIAEIALHPQTDGPLWTDMAQLARLLNGGVLRTADGRALADLGLHASGAEGRLTLARASGPIGADSGVVVAGQLVTGKLDPGMALASDIQIFTREGRHIAGTAMTPFDIAALMITANGFDAEARYRADYLNAEGAGAGYRGLTLMRGSVPGDHLLRLAPGDGLPGAPVLWQGAAEPMPAPPGRLTLDLGAAGRAEILPPQGATAGHVADLINALSPRLPLRAVAETRVEILAPEDGILSFRLAGRNVQPLGITAPVVGGNLAALAESVNRISHETGITASLSPAGGRLILHSASGHDINISALGHSVADTPVTLRAVDDRGVALPGTTAALGTPGGANGARFAGVLTLQAAGAFQAGFGDALQPALADPTRAGLVQREVLGAGTVQRLRFGVLPGIDGHAGDLTGQAAIAAAAAYDLSLPTAPGLPPLQARVSAALLPSATPAAIAAALAQALRAQAPVPALEGGALASPPPPGSTVALMLGNERYVVEMTRDGPVVTGPEPDRLLIQTEADGRLRIVANGGITEGAGLRLAREAEAPGNAAAAALFGLSSAEARLTGVAALPGTLPQGETRMTVQVNGTSHDIAITRSGDALTIAAPGFPGAVTVDPASGRLSLRLDDPGAVLLVPPSEGAQALGFVTSSAALSVVGDSLVLRARGDQALDVAARGESLAANRISLSGLPDEDLIVVLSGGGARLLAGSIALPTGPRPPAQPEVTFRVIDPRAGLVEVLDAATGHSIATRQLREGATRAAGYSFLLSGLAGTGDRFHVGASSEASGDGRNLDAILALRDRDPVTGRGGFGDLYRALLADAGAQARSGQIRLTSTTAQRDAVAMQVAERSAVDLDTETARMIEQQQAYQASARVLAMARELFDTLLQSM